MTFELHLIKKIGHQGERKGYQPRREKKVGICTSIYSRCSTKTGLVLVKLSGSLLLNSISGARKLLIELRMSFLYCLHTEKEKKRFSI